jgi:hypothetical protein
MGATESPNSPEWIGKVVRNLPRPIHTEHVREWFGRRKASPLAGLEKGLKRQLEMLRDEIAQARSAGLSWSAIGKMVGLHPDVVRSIHAE